MNDALPQSKVPEGRPTIAQRFNGGMSQPQTETSPVRDERESA